MATRVSDHAANDQVRRTVTRQVAAREFPAELAADLYRHADQMTRELFGGDLPEVVLSFQKKNVRNWGHYVPGRTPHGLKWSININWVYVESSACQVLETLLHELVHCWQHQHGSPAMAPYHNAEFRIRAKELGIPSDNRGHSLGALKGSPFYDYCKRHGVKWTEHRCRAKGYSKLKKWTCRCGINLRVAVDLDATCNKCGSLFELQE